MDRGTPIRTVGADDDQVKALAAASGLRATDECSGITWMTAYRRPSVEGLPDGFRIVDRRSDNIARTRRSLATALRLRHACRECSQYDSTLDLSVEHADGTIAGCAVFWFDEVTGVGMLEPMRVEDAYQRRGLARSLLAVGLDRLATKGTRRFKVGFDSEAGRNLYCSSGFVEPSVVRVHRRSG
jgi:predicted N-acetyltransferase YhbS